MTISELIKSLIDSSKERIKTPIAGAYFLSFIIFNWRPILILIFSDKSIESKILIINQQYSTLGTLFWPLIIAVSYSIAIPCLMLGIEFLLIKPSRQRRKNVYSHKTSELDLQIILAGKELQLQDARTENKEMKNLLDEISYLKGENNNLLETSKLNSEGFNLQMSDANKKLKAANETIIRLNKEIDDENSYNRDLVDSLSKSDYISILNELNYKDIGFLTNLTIDNPNKVYTPKTLSESAKQIMRAKETISTRENGAYTITAKGFDFITQIKKLYGSRIKTN